MFKDSFIDVLIDPGHEILDSSHVRAAKSSLSLRVLHTQSMNIDEGSEHACLIPTI